MGELGWPVLFRTVVAEGSQACPYCHSVGGGMGCRNVPSYPVLFRWDASFENIQGAIKGDPTMSPEWGEVTCIKDIPSILSWISTPALCKWCSWEYTRQLPLGYFRIIFHSTKLSALLSPGTQASLRLLQSSFPCSTDWQAHCLRKSSKWGFKFSLGTVPLVLFLSSLLSTALRWLLSGSTPYWEDLANIACLPVLGTA